MIILLALTSFLLQNQALLLVFSAICKLIHLINTLHFWNI